MRYSEQDVENHLQDIWKLQCFVNAEEVEDVFDSRMKVSVWIEKYDFSEVELVNHLMDFYQVEEIHEVDLLEIVRTQVLEDLIKFITQYGVREYGNVHLEKSEFWERFLFELGKTGVSVNQINPSDEMAVVLQSNLSNFVFALSRISPGAIKSFSVSKRSGTDLWMMLLIGLGIVELGLLAFSLYHIVLILLIPLIVLGFIVFYLQKKSPEITYVNGYSTFQDMIDNITELPQ